MSLVRWKDKAELTTLIGTEKMPITNDSNVDQFVTPDTIAALNDASISSVNDTANDAATDAATALATANDAIDIANAFSLLALQPNGWNAATNTPTLANGTGVANQAYIITVGGARNLGAGSVTFIAGYTLYYAEGIWSQAQLSNTSSLDSVTDGADRKAVTANQKLGLDNSLVAITTANPVVSRTELDTAISNVEVSVSGAENYIQNYEVDGFVSGTGVLRTLSGLGYSTPTVRAKFPRMFTRYGDVPLTLSYDTAVMREAVLSLGYGAQTYLTTMTNRKFILNDQIIIASVKIDVPTTDRTTSQQWLIDFKGCRINDVRTGTSSTPLFIKEPIDASTAANNDLEFALKFRNADIYGDPDLYANSVCFKIGAAKRFVLENVSIHNYDIGFLGSLLLNSLVKDCEFINCITSGFKTSVGWWTGAAAGSTPSQITFLNNRFKDAGLKYLDLTNADTCSLIGNNHFEGTAGDYAIYWDNNNVSVIKNLLIQNIRVESDASTKFARAIVGVRAADGFSVTLDKIFNQVAIAGTVLLEAEAVGGGDTRIEITNCYNSGGNGAWKFRNIGSNCWEINKTTITGQPSTEAELRSGVAPYDNIWATDFAGTIPTNNRVNFTQRLPKIII
jgi:hypothetical protein